jgi:hypothetical protein
MSTGEPAGTNGVVTGTGLHPGGAVADKSEHDILEVCTEWGELVGTAAETSANLRHTMLSASSLRRHRASKFLATPLKAVLQRAAASGRHEKLPDNQHRPPVAAMIKAPRETTVLAVRPLHDL